MLKENSIIYYKQLEMRKYMASLPCTVVTPLFLLNAWGNII